MLTILVSLLVGLILVKKVDTNDIYLKFVMFASSAIATVIAIFIGSLLYVLSVKDSLPPSYTVASVDKISNVEINDNVYRYTKKVDDNLYKREKLYSDDVYITTDNDSDAYITVYNVTKTSKIVYFMLGDKLTLRGKVYVISIPIQTDTSNKETKIGI